MQMAYEPDSRYLKDGLDRKKEVDAPFAEQPETHKGQFWNVGNHIGGRWARAGAFLGLMLAVVDPFDWNYALFPDSRVGSLLAFYAVFAAGGLAIGLIAASIRRRVTGEV
jgi:hypothetical protein